MKDSKIAGILLGAVAVFVLVAVLLYILISYILWRRKPEADRKNHWLNCLFKCSPRKHKNDNYKKEKGNASYVNKSFTTIEQDDVVTNSGSYVNKSFTTTEQDVAINTEGVTLEVPRSPIRKSAETYSIVDLNEDG